MPLHIAELIANAAVTALSLGSLIHLPVQKQPDTTAGLVSHSQCLSLLLTMSRSRDHFVSKLPIEVSAGVRVQAANAFQNFLSERRQCLPTSIIFNQL